MLAALGPSLLVAQVLPAGGRAGAPPPQGPADVPPPVFRSGVTLVQIDAFVTDADGNPVTGLTADDFEVFERGEPRPVTTFSAVDIPIALPPGTPRGDEAEPDIQTNSRPPGRTFLIALDEISPDRTLRARNIVRRFIADHFGPNDVAAVTLTGRGLSSSGQDFTGNRRLILEAVDKFSGGFEASTPNVQGWETDPQSRSRPSGVVGVQGPAVDKAFSSDARQLASSLRRLTEFLATLPGRKTLLYVGEGLGAIDFFDVVDYNGGALTPASVDAHAAVAAATRGNVTIYPIDPRGLTTDLTPAGAIASDPDPLVGIAQATEILSTRADLAALADVTGGFAATNTNDLAETFARIVHESSVFYTLGFNAGYPKLDGRFVRVEVRVKRPGLQVRARNGYVAPLGEQREPTRVRGKTQLPAVADALASPIASRGLPMRVFAAPYRDGGGANVLLAVEIDASKLPFDAADSALTSDLEITYVATDARSRVVPGRRHAATLAVKPEARQRVFEQGVRVLSQFTLAPGRYQLRVAAGSGATAGSVVYDLEVPDFSKGDLSLSGVALTSRAAAAVTTLRPEDPLRDALPSPPTAFREFDRADELVLFAEIYDNRRPAKGTLAAPIEMSATVERDGRTIRIAGLETRPATASRRRSGGHPFTVRLPLAGLESGRYVIVVEAHAGDAPAVSRRVPIEIR
jgi:VWFA-related protein